MTPTPRVFVSSSIIEDDKTQLSGVLLVLSEKKKKLKIPLAQCKALSGEIYGSELVFIIVITLTICIILLAFCWLREDSLYMQNHLAIS